MVISLSSKSHFVTVSGSLSLSLYFFRPLSPCGFVLLTLEVRGFLVLSGFISTIIFIVVTSNHNSSGPVKSRIVSPTKVLSYG